AVVVFEFCGNALSAP
ncbi:hypothetical protein VCCP1035_3380B, partial [Vibrio cholerae CP1035(8)]